MEELVMSEEQIQQTCRELGAQISHDLKDEEKIPLIVGVLKGGANFMMDLVKNIDIPVMLDFVGVSSYEGTETTGTVNLTKDLSLSAEGRTIVLVEDCVDTGLSMKYLVNYLQETFNPKQILICALFNKLAIRRVDLEIAYSGMTFEENKFLIGYGLDYNEIDRNLPYVYTPTKYDLKKMDKLLDKRS